MNNAVAIELYQLSKSRHFDRFVDLLDSMKNNTTLRSNQLDHLINIDYFQSFGNIPTLSRILEFYDFTKQGTAKQFKKEKLTPAMTELIAPFATDKNKDGKELKSYTVTDMPGLLKAAEDKIRSFNLPDLDLRTRIQNNLDLLGYVGIQTKRPEDRCRLIVMDVWPLTSKDTGEPWAYRVSTQSVGTGKTASLTVYANLFQKDPIVKGDIIRTTPGNVGQKRGYWYLYDYTKEI